jgi:hypothetical protein
MPHLRPMPSAIAHVAPALALVPGFAAPGTPRRPARGISRGGALR